MAWREYLNLFEKYEGDIGRATEREVEHADRGMDPALAKRIAEADYNRKERMQNNEQGDMQNTAEQSTKAAVGDSSGGGCLF